MFLQDPASKKLLIVLNVTSTSELSYLRYIPHYFFKWGTDHNIFPILRWQKVENRLFQVPRNGFIVPGTPFEAMFALPQTQTDSIEGSSLDNPIHFQGIKVDHFRSFLRVLYPLCVLMILLVKYSSVYDKILQRRPETGGRIWWVGWSAEFMNLATMWLFQEVRSLPLQKISVLRFKSSLRSVKVPLSNFQTSLNTKQSRKGSF